ncbi:TniB family NTP-binding protein [Leisingera caerulea]|uniref:TniB family NTP-binding protein n=1 Tax=Leisingera caerulea TaxID=506591 RepID=UPI0021A2882D|nr:TniB family NTP-binding protein [Leisingera caerulea]UWQ50654.1 TniB family NTP-binding protein [Leisingera caerulea]
MTMMTSIPAPALAAVDRAASKYIPTGRDKDFRHQLDRLFARDDTGALTAALRKDPGTGDAKGLAVIEAPGGGKSTLIEKGLSRHPFLEPEFEGHLPYIKINAPSPATPKSLLIELLMATGYADVSWSKSEQEITKLLRHRLQLCGVLIVWIDEAHDLIGGGTPHKVQTTVKSTKNLMQGVGAVGLILSGIDTLWTLISSDEQLNRRFSKMPLKSVTAVSDEKMLNSIVRTLCKEVGVEAPVSSDLLERLVHASRGRFGRFIEYTLAALETAAYAGDALLDVHHFAQAWAQREGCEQGQNVFLAKNWAQIDLGQVPGSPARGGH